MAAGKVGATEAAAGAPMAVDSAVEAVDRAARANG